jgi:hypothetical protein
MLQIKVSLSSTIGGFFASKAMIIYALFDQN